jgi:hypothetical protein
MTEYEMVEALSAAIRYDMAVSDEHLDTELTLEEVGRTPGSVDLLLHKDVRNLRTTSYFVRLHPKLDRYERFIRGSWEQFVPETGSKALFGATIW